MDKELHIAVPPAIIDIKVGLKNSTYFLEPIEINEDRPTGDLSSLLRFAGRAALPLADSQG